MSQIPNQPMVFTGDWQHKSRSEVGTIARFRWIAQPVAVLRVSLMQQDTHSLVYMLTIDTWIPACSTGRRDCLYVEPFC